ncbi:hypothetical protein AB6A40_002058 [Gnathostoma spinigerum]|uniref:SUMO-activating enzyme subunit n=1 Tax=Gnathostoma spinigerum TaxID=75299 RepID=A0ABD6EDD7_9BILA
MGWRDQSFLSALKCRILVVGAGGIGCELLKNLVLTGFSDIEVIDLDTIEVSNLNRQFLFRREHVGKSKAATAAESVSAFAKDVKIVYHYDSIVSEKYSVDFFQQFTVVLNALDNRAARNHVNRMCHHANVPLVESGSSGYLGQVSVIIRGRTECYECIPQQAQKTYPGCTIRNTPSEHIHCTVWAKHLFNQLFGEDDAEDDVSPDLTDEEISEGKVTNGGASEHRKLNSGDEHSTNGVDHIEKSETQTEVEKKRESTRNWAASHSYDPQRLFQKFFNEDIKYLLSMENLWKERRKPTPLVWNDLPNEHAGSSRGEMHPDVWTVLTCRNEFQTSMKELAKRSANGSILTWDKDDDAAMHFVAACANMRAYIFNIPMRTLFDIKSMAGNIIPAIATTNAIVAGMIVVEALKIVRGQFDRVRDVFIMPKPNHQGKILVDQIRSKPNQSCIVCSDKRDITLRVNVNETSVRSLETKFLKGVLNMVAPDVLVSMSNMIIISSDEDEMDAEVGDKTLAAVGVVHGSFLECDDFLQQLNFRLLIFHSLSLKADEFEIASDSASADLSSGNTEEGKTKRKLDVAENECDVPTKRSHQSV